MWEYPLIVIFYNEGRGDESTATWGRISVDRGSKATLPRTIPCREFKSSAKDSTDHSFETVIKGIHASYVQNSCGGNLHHAPLGAIALLLDMGQMKGSGVAFLAWILT
ncbi:hypothetical protein KSP40_PGU009379 [Platanthera guangdongensis]|uniref:Uncharacterized protein n=1 Tax=Platanthera guangdongensis TaxID=2320717 RepID=A0ABR2N186_9ASPA